LPRILTSLMDDEPEAMGLLALLRRPAHRQTCCATATAARSPAAATTTSGNASDSVYPWVAAQGLSTHWLRHTTLTWVNGLDQPLVVAVGKPQSEVSIDLALVFGLGLGKGRHEVAGLVEDHRDVVDAELFHWLLALLGDAEAFECSVPFGQGFGDPAGDGDRIGPRVEGGPIPRQPGLVGGQQPFLLPPRGLRWRSARSCLVAEAEQPRSSACWSAPGAGPWVGSAGELVAGRL